MIIIVSKLVFEDRSDFWRNCFRFDNVQHNMIDLWWVSLISRNLLKSYFHYWFLIILTHWIKFVANLIFMIQSYFLSMMHKISAKFKTVFSPKFVIVYCSSNRPNPFYCYCSLTAIQTHNLLMFMINIHMYEPNLQSKITICYCFIFLWPNIKSIISIRSFPFFAKMDYRILNISRFLVLANTNFTGCHHVCPCESKNRLLHYSRSNSPISITTVITQLYG